jgi:hypothetical protein
MPFFSPPERHYRDTHFVASMDYLHKLHAGEREAQPKLSDWAYSYAGKPREFMRELIGPAWDTPDWQSWRAFISALFAVPMETAGEMQVFRKATQLTAQPDHRPSSVWLPCGRRAGKSRMLAALACYIACCFNWRGCLVAGEIGVLPILALDRR